MESILDIEKKYLEYTKSVIAEEIKKCINSEYDLKKDSLKLSFEDRLRGEHLNLNSKLHNFGTKVAKLERAKKCPYFGRIDLKKYTCNETTPIYIGKTTINHNNKNVVYDWRSPICGLYYDSKLGPVSYNSPSGIQTGELLLKRQILIEDGNLINAFDSNLVTDDDLLLPYLDVNADDRMKTIIASIQKEQNSIIRSKDDNIIVQGVAGSGKTSVALHRIAYLIYAMNDIIASDGFLVIGPNDYFLNYVSSVLPELETTPVQQTTLLDLMNDYIGTNLALYDEELSSKKENKEPQKNIRAFKGSFEYRDLLDKYINECFNGNEIVADDFKIDGKVVFSANQIRDRLVSSNGKYFDFERTRKYYKDLFKDTKDDIYSRLNKEYREIYTSLPKADPKRKEAVDKSFELEKMVKQQGDKLLDKYFKTINKSALSLYVSFLCKLDKENTSLTKEEISLLQKVTLKAIRKKQIPFEDISALLYLNHMFTNKKLSYSNVVIDEAQDYSMLTYYALKNIFDHARFNIYGDLAQAIHYYRSVPSWEELNEKVFQNKCNLLELSKSYRTTIEITEAANNVLNYLNLHEAEPVIRHGASVEYLDINNNCDIKIKKVREWIESGYQTIAVICKEEEEAKKVQEELTSQGINSKYVSNKDNQYTGGVCVLTVASAKGLEFDCVIINDASDSIYKANNNIDMHLLYVASTRSLHEQIVLYNRKISEPFKKEITQTKVLKKIK